MLVGFSLAIFWNIGEVSVPRGGLNVGGVG